MHDKATLPALAGAFVLTIAATGVWMVGTYMAAESYDDFVKNRQPQPYSYYEQVKVTATGEPLIALYRHGSIEDWLNPDRSKILSDSRLVVTCEAELTDNRGLGAWGPTSRQGRFVHVQQPPRREALSESWYLVMDDVATGRCWLEGYDRQTLSRIGYIGRQGLSAAIPSVADQFAPAPGPILRLNSRKGLLQWDDFLRLYGEHNTTAIYFDGHYPLADRQCVILDDAGVHVIDLAERTTSMLVPGPVDAIAAVSLLEPLPEGFVIDDPQDKWKDDHTYRLKMFLAVRTPTAIQLFDLNGDERKELQLPPELQSGDIQLVLLSDGSAVARRYVDKPARPVEAGIEAATVQLKWFQPDGQVTRQLDVDWWRNTPVIGPEQSMLIGVATAPEPLVSGMIVGLMAALERPDRAAAGVSQRLATVLHATWPAIVFSVFGGVLAAWLLDRHRRLRRLPRSWRWLAFALLMGIPGFVGYVWHRRWPVTKLAPPPQRSGIEIIVA